MKYDILIVGAGLTGACIAYKNRNNKVLVIEKNSFPGGLCYSEQMNGIEVHKFGPHIFHTDRKDCWDFVNSIAEFIPFNLNVKAFNKQMYSLPFNMNTFYELWGCTSIGEAKEMYKTNFNDIYKTFIEDYSKKQWGIYYKEIVDNVIKRLPVRFTWNNSYYDDLYVGIPKEGYTNFINKLLYNADVMYNTDFLQDKEKYEAMADIVYYTGPLDAYYDYKYGELQYRYIKHKHQTFNKSNFQGCPIVNFTSKDVPWTRVIEHKHFMPYKETQSTVVSYEYPGNVGIQAYPITNEDNTELYQKYRNIPNDKMIPVGRLAEYRYYDMNDIIEKYAL